jgi:hypothetical protein
MFHELPIYFFQAIHKCTYLLDFYKLTCGSNIRMYSAIANFRLSLLFLFSAQFGFIFVASSNTTRPQSRYY